MREQEAIALGDHDIHLWLASYADVLDEDTNSRYWSVLSQEERQQQPRFYFAADRRRYLLTRALVRIVLSRYSPLAPADWLFVTNPHGRPEIANPEVPGAPLTFNISHTHSLIVLGVTRRACLGVDVENICAREVSLGIADHFFAPEEVASLATVARHRQQYRFFEYWTFKEAYIKARGMGLSLPLDKFSFDFPDDHSVAIKIDPQLSDDPARWRFWQFQPAPQYLVAVCGERLGPEPVTLTVRAVRPAISEAILLPIFLRISAQAIESNQ